ncbi:MAG: 3-oxo-tetronate kinase [Burkholderiaceae bacterium]
MLLGCIADDFTGATDLANNLVRNGMRVVQTIGIPGQSGSTMTDVDAVVVSLKSRTTPKAEAISESLQALQWLRDAGCRQFYFKYCSTFDSTDDGNIGPVTDALMTALDTDFTIACPAFPATGRTIFRGHLFVNDELLSDSSMQHHPLTPMTDANLVRVLQRQTSRKVGLLRYDTIAAGSTAVASAIEQLRRDGVEIAIADSLHDADLHELAAGCIDLPLLTAGSGVAIGLPTNFQSQGLLDTTDQAAALPAAMGPAVVISGSCSSATLKQVESFAQTNPRYQVDPLRLAQGPHVLAEVVSEAVKVATDAQAAGQAAVIHASAEPAAVKAVQDSLGREAAGALVEDALAQVAGTLHAGGTRRFVVAGGETSGAVVQALKIQALRIGPQIDPGVPWTETVSNDSSVKPLALALKSGNFGAEDFFQKSLAMLENV